MRQEELVVDYVIRKRRSCSYRCKNGWTDDIRRAAGYQDEDKARSDLQAHEVVVKRRRPK